MFSLLKLLTNMPSCDDAYDCDGWDELPFSTPDDEGIDAPASHSISPSQGNMILNHSTIYRTLLIILCDCFSDVVVSGMSDVFKTEPWALKLKEFVKKDVSSRNFLMNEVVPLLRSRFSSTVDMTKFRGRLGDIILSAFSDDDIKIYESPPSDESKLMKKNITRRINYYYDRIFDAVFPTKDKKEIDRRITLLVKREREMIMEQDFINNTNLKDSDGNSESLESTESSSNKKSKRKDFDTIGMSVHIERFKKLFPNHYPPEDLIDAIRDKWFATTPIGIIKLDRGYGLSNCGGYVMDIINKLPVRRLSTRSVTPQFNPEAIIVGDMTEKGLDIDNQEDCQLYELQCREQIQETSVMSTSYYFSKTLLNIIPHSLWEGHQLVPVKTSVPRGLNLRKVDSYGPGITGENEDYFITPIPVIEALFTRVKEFQSLFENNSQLVFYDPCCGNGVIGNVIKQLYGDKAIVCERDKFPKNNEPSFNYLIKEDRLPSPEYDIMITNPPYSQKTQFIETAYKEGKPFLLLLPVQSLMTPKRMAMFKYFGITLLLVTPTPKFKCGKTGKSVSINGEVAWFFWNGTVQTNHLEVQYLSNDKTDKNVTLFQTSLIESMANNVE